MTAWVQKNLPEEGNGIRKKDGRSYRLHREQKEVARGTADWLVLAYHNRLRNSRHLG